MSSGFVSERSGEAADPQSDDWAKAKEAIDATRKRKLDVGGHDGGKSLYDVLQQNKATKQEAFEESIRLKNQFRTLDDDEIDFLDSVLESTRAKEEDLKKETAEQLAAFRKQREDAEKSSLEGKALDEQTVAVASVNEESWATEPSRKRRRGREKERDHLIGSKLPRKTLSGEEQVKSSAAESISESISTQSDQVDHLTRGSNAGVSDQSQGAKVIPSAEKNPSTSQANLPSLGLGAYSSDED